MTPTTTLHPAVVEARTLLNEGRAKCREQHDQGAPGLQVCYRWTDIVDGVIINLSKIAIEETQDSIKENQVAIVAHSGYGRRDLAPYSDIDLMLLYEGAREEEVAPLARLLAQFITDSGLQAGFSVRTPRQATRLSLRDPTIFSALTECRFLVGSQELLERFSQSFKVATQRNSQRIIRMVNESRLEERQKFGETSFLLHPNVKRSRGCLRDIQLVRWIGFAAYGEADPEQLVQRGCLLPEDFQALRKGYQYLLRLRNQLHFDAKRSQDSLDRSIQVRLAQWAGYEGSDGVLPVEEFMQEYFARTSEVRYSAAHFVASAEARGSVVQSAFSFLSIPIGTDFRVGLKQIWATKRGLGKLQRSVSKVLELMTLANRYNRRIAHRTWQTIRTAMLRRDPAPLDDETRKRFLALMQHTPQLGQMLRRLHELRVLEQIIPAMKHARYLLQFNEYHKFTVDAHCIQSVVEATEFAKEYTTLGDTYRGITDKTVLHLALLLHDLGKGFIEDHSEVGKRLAEETAGLLRLTDSQRDLLVFLVHQHLLMAHTAFRFDLSQKSGIVQFASQVGSRERLQHLFVVTCADLAAVGPGTLNDWKKNLIIQLYEATAAQFGDEQPDIKFQERIKGLREAVMRHVRGGAEIGWYREQVAAIPVAYLLQDSPQQLADELVRLSELSETQKAVAWGEYQYMHNAVQYSVAFKQSQPIGSFHRITGALSSQGLQILSAEINSQPQGIAWDRFVVEDNDFEGPPPQSRIDDVCEKIIKALDPSNAKPPNFRRIWKSKTEATPTLRNQPTQVRFDNSTSDQFTIISIFAYDRTGLLYDIAKTIYDAKLILHVAKISTHLDQVVDVFYVTDLEGKKVTIPTLLYTLRQSLLKAVEQFENGLE